MHCQRLKVKDLLFLKMYVTELESSAYCPELYSVKWNPLLTLAQRVQAGSLLPAHPSGPPTRQ